MSHRVRLRRLLASALLLLAGGGSVVASDASPIDIFVSVLPLKTFVEQVGGDRVRVHTMVLPGQSPATYDPTPKQVAALGSAALYVRVGVAFEDAWMARIRAANPDMPVLDVREGLRLRPQQYHEHGHADGQTSDAMDPHVWTSPRLVRAMLPAIRDQLTTLDPSGAAFYTANQRRFDAKLAALDAELTAMLAGLRQRRFLVYHPAWGYFADAYGLEQVPIEREGKEPGARRLSSLIEQARASGIRVIFVQPQFDRRAATRVAREIGGRVESMDPLSADYVGGLRRAARLIAEANSRPAGGPE